MICLVTHGVHNMGPWSNFHLEYFRRFENRTIWRLKFALLPKKCDLTGKTIWFKIAYKGTAVWTGPGAPIQEDKWHGKLEHLVWQIKRGGK